MSYAAGIAVLAALLGLIVLTLFTVRLFGQVRGLGRTVAAASERITAASSRDQDRAPRGVHSVAKTRDHDSEESP